MCEDTGSENLLESTQTDPGQRPGPCGWDGGTSQEMQIWREVFRQLTQEVS